MNLTSGIRRRYNKKFILDEDGLRRLEGVLLRAASNYASSALKVVYRVEREDARFYETESLEEVLNDANLHEKRVKLVGLELREASLPPTENRSLFTIAYVVFSREPGFFSWEGDATVNISCPERTWALLLADELEPQVERLFKARATPRLPALLVVGLSIFGICRAASIAIRRWVDVPPAISVLAGLAAVLASGFVFSSMMQVFGGAKWVERYFGPESAFLWGDETVEYAQRENLRRTISNSVIVAFLVSFAAGVVLMLL